MVTKLNTYKIRECLLILTLFFLASCTKEELYLSKDFEFPASLSPVKESYIVGDTIDIKIQFDKILEDREKKIKYLFENYNFETSVRIVELTNKSEPLAGQSGSIQSFQFLNKVGGIFPFGSGGGELDLVFTNGSYVLSSSMILRKSGVYAISLIINTSQPAQLINPPVGYDQITAGVGATFFILNSGEGLNFHLITQNTASNYDNPSPDDWARPVFAFRVEE